MPGPEPASPTSFREIKADILRRISHGDWGPNSLLPGEVELARMYGCARATVNRALRELAEEGIVERKRKAGTRVRPSPLRQARFEIPLVARNSVNGKANSITGHEISVWASSFWDIQNWDRE